jgi:hypothetical protein
MSSGVEVLFRSTPFSLQLSPVVSTDPGDVFCGTVGVGFGVAVAMMITGVGVGGLGRGVGVG